MPQRVRSPKTWLAVAALLTSGCLFPLPFTYRGGFDGVVVDEQGKPVGKANVVVCSAFPRVWDPTARCIGPAVAHSNGAGRFHVPRYREWEWGWWMPVCRIPMTTFVGACGEIRGRRAGSAFNVVQEGAAGDKSVTLVQSRELNMLAPCIFADGTRASGNR